MKKACEVESYVIASSPKAIVTNANKADRKNRTRSQLHDFVCLGFAGKTSFERAQTDMVIDCFEDFIAQHMMKWFLCQDPVEKVETLCLTEKGIPK